MKTIAEDVSHFLEFLHKSFHLNTKFKNLKIGVWTIQKVDSLWNLLSLFPKLKRLKLWVLKCEEQMENNSHFRILKQMKDLKNKRLKLCYLNGDRVKEFKKEYKR